MDQTYPDGGRELATVETGTLALITGAEIDRQIATAKKYPRSQRDFLANATGLVTYNQTVAEECIYTLKRKEPDGSEKLIRGPSVRFAEIILSCYSNVRAGARVVGEDAEFIYAQGIFHDLERNVALTRETQRRIVGRNNRRYGVDMIGVTGNAACSIAFRNAIVAGVPGALWRPIYIAAEQCIAGTKETLAARRTTAIEALTKMGANEAQIYAYLGVRGIEDIGLDHIITLRGIFTSVRDGELSIAEAFAIESTEQQFAAPSAKPKAAPEPRASTSNAAGPAEQRSEAAQTDAGGAASNVAEKAGSAPETAEATSGDLGRADPMRTKPEEAQAAAGGNPAIPPFELAADPAPKRARDDGPRLSAAHIGVIEKKAQMVGVKREDVEAQFGGKLETLAASRFTEINGWISSLNV